LKSKIDIETKNFKAQRNLVASEDSHSPVCYGTISITTLLLRLLPGSSPRPHLNPPDMTEKLVAHLFLIEKMPQGSSMIQTKEFKTMMSRFPKARHCLSKGPSTSLGQGGQHFQTSQSYHQQ
jgi:hypothetical protein